MRKNLMSLLFALALFPVIASAQNMGGGNHHGGGPASPPSNGMHDGNDVMGGAMGNHRGLVVGTDGMLYTVRVTNPTTDSSSAATFEIVAVRPDGVIGWTSAVGVGMTRIELSGNQLLVTITPHEFGAGTIPTFTSSVLVALSTASGSEQWRLPLDGFAADLEPFSGGTYVVVFKPGTRQSSVHSTRTLVAVGTDGKVLWSVPLTR